MYPGKYSAAVGKCLGGVQEVSRLRLFSQWSVPMTILVAIILAATHC